MKLEIPHPDRGFKTLTRDGLTLITPRHDKFKWAPEDRVYRSVVIDENNEVVSSGFPKFGNYLEIGFEDHKALIEASDDVIYTTKADGSLACRSVIRGKVIWRTRGTLDGGPFREHIERAAEIYPDLSNPYLMSQHSLLFEFVSPNFRVILPYDHDKLIFLGMIDHSNMNIVDWWAAKHFAEIYGWEIIETHVLPNNLDELMNIVKEWKNQEGIVARTGRGDAMIKVKSASYLALHRLRFMLSTRALRDLCDEQDITDVEQFKAFILTQGADWELLQDCEPIVQVYCDTRKAIDAEFTLLRTDVTLAKTLFPTRKDFAVEYANQQPDYKKPAIFLLLDDREKHAKLKLHKAMMDRAFEGLKELDPVEET